MPLPPREGKPRCEKKCDRNQPDGPNGRHSRSLVHFFIVELINGLSIVALLRTDPQVRIAWQETVYLVSANAALMLVYEDQLPPSPAARQIGGDVELNFPSSFL